jgi:hypothetical protein
MISLCDGSAGSWDGFDGSVVDTGVDVAADEQADISISKPANRSIAYFFITSFSFS